MRVRAHGNRDVQTPQLARLRWDGRQQSHAHTDADSTVDAEWRVGRPYPPRGGKAREPQRDVPTEMTDRLARLEAKNVFWQVAGQATLGTTSDFKGIILSKTLIAFNTGATFTSLTVMVIVSEALAAGDPLSVTRTVTG